MKYLGLRQFLKALTGANIILVTFRDSNKFIENQNNKLPMDCWAARTVAAGRQTCGWVTTSVVDPDTHMQI